MDVIVDSHCHINMIDNASAETVIACAQKDGVGHMLCVSVDLETFPEVRQLAKKYDCVSASVGVHPNTKLEVEPGIDHILELADDPDIVAIGETGLDYFRSTGDLEWQRDRFRMHIQAARAIKKPLIVHSRDAKQDVITILAEEKADEIGGVMHCFVDDWETASRAIDLNFLISFSGIVTFKNAQELKKVAKRVPLDKILIETDSPYLAPAPYRGKTNQPAYVRHVAEHIAELRGQALAEIAQATTNNFFTLFKDARNKVAGLN